MSVLTKSLFAILLIAFVCNTFAQTCGGGNGTLAGDGTTCLCSSGYSGDGTGCTAETTIGGCNITAPDNLNSPAAITLGAGTDAGGFILNINVPFEATRTLVNVTFSASASSYDYPPLSNFGLYVRSALNSSCSDKFTVTIPNSAFVAGFGISMITSNTAVQYTGTATITTVETLSEGLIRTVTQAISFDYTFPVVEASIASIDVVSTIGTVLKSNLLQQASGSNTVTLEVQLATPWPYQLDWVASAPVSGTKFSGTDVAGPTTYNPALTYTPGVASSCGVTSKDVTCIQTASVVIDYTSGCSVDGSYTLTFAVTGCNSVNSTTPTVDCLIANNDAVEDIPVTVTISSLTMGNLCTKTVVYSGSASALVVYADSTFTTVKSQFINDAAQTNMYFQTAITLGDAPSIAAYSGCQITAVARECTGVSTCTGAYIPFTAGNITTISTAQTAVQFSVPVAAFTELTTATSDIPYAIEATIELFFNDAQTKRYVTAKFDVTPNSKSSRNTQSSVSAFAVGDVQFIQPSQGATGVTAQQSASSKLSGSSASVAVAALCAGAVALYL